MKKNEILSSNFLLYQTEDGRTRIDVKFEEDTVWLNQKGLAELYQTTPQNITLHIRNIYADGEHTSEATCKDYLQVQNEGGRDVSRYISYYNLEMILAIGYRVRSHRGVQFRRWATEKLREYLQKGFVLDDYRLKEGKAFGRDYFDELLERIRDIRSSEKMFYRKITDIYALSVDYDPQHPISQEFFATVQNKLHYAVHGKTAAEIIQERADSHKPNMGLTNWKNKTIRKSDVDNAKNYLHEPELKELNRIVTMYLDYAEDQAERQIPMHMKDWKEKLDAFLRFNGREILANPGRVSHEVAKELAYREYEKYRADRIAMNDMAADDVNKLNELSQQTTSLKRGLKRK
jgi:hypothetical protein